MQEAAAAAARRRHRGCLVAVGRSLCPSTHLQVSKMVFIGKDLDRELIEEGFKECVVSQ